MDAGVQLGEALQQRGIVLDFQSRRAPGAAQSARGVHVAATSHQAVTVDLGRGQGIQHIRGHVSKGSVHMFPFDSS